MADNDTVVDVEIKGADYYLEHPDEFDALSDDEQSRIIQGGALDIQGDTKAKEAEEPAAAPDAATEEEAADGKEAVAAEEESVVLTRDGKHTIPFSELQKARDTAAHWEQVASDQKALLEQLQAAQQADKGTGETVNQDEVLASLQENFPELAEILAPALQKMVEAGVSQRVSALEAKLNQTLQPLQQTAEEQARADHFAKIEAAHPDYESILEGGRLDEWISNQPSFVRDQYNAVLQQGTASQVNELFQAFKDANGFKPDAGEATPSKADLAAKAKEVIGKANKAKPPVSLSDIPAGSAAPHDEAEALTQMSGLALLDKLTSMSPDKIEALMRRVV